MTTERTSTATVLIISLLIANIGLSTYTAFRPLPAPAGELSKEAATSAITDGEANKMAGAMVPLYNERNVSALYERFDQLAKVQFTKEQLTTQMEKLGTVIGRIDGYAYSHATVAGNQGGRTYYTLHYKVSLSGGPFPTGDLTITVARNAEGLSLFGFFINGTSGPQNQ
ncbi:MAG: hypothetical protein ACHQ5A_03650 [Opitutales bacterium]